MYPANVPSSLLYVVSLTKFLFLPAQFCNVSILAAAVTSSPLKSAVV